MSGDTPVEIIFGKDGVTQYEAVKELLKKKVEPELSKYLKELNVQEQLKKVETIDQLSGVTVEYITDSFKELLFDTIDAVEGLADHQKVWLFATFLSSFMQGSSAFIDVFFQKRAQEIMNNKRIIKPH